MRVRVLAALVLVGAATLTLSLIRGQDQPGPRANVVPAHTTVLHPPAQPAAEFVPLRDPAEFNELQKQIHLSAQRGSEWMFRMHGVKGRFLNGRTPALAKDADGGSYLRQVGAAFALARAARLTGEERFAARAAQTILALLEETALDHSDATARHTTLPSAFVNRLGAAGYLVMAINELPAPQKDLLEKSEQLCQYIRKQARTDGSLAHSDDKAESDGVNEFPGAALCGLAVSQRHRPAAWKTEALKSALPYYRAWWTKSPNRAFVPLMSAAYAEAHARSKEKSFGEFVLEMNDWLCNLQYSRVEPRRVGWYGGFMSWQNGQAVESMPTAECATCFASLVEACRVARELGDVARHKNYGEALGIAYQFLTTLQYTEATTQHFADWYRPQLVGGFHHSPEDGNLRIDYNQHAVAGLWAYLEQVR